MFKFLFSKKTLLTVEVSARNIRRVRALVSEGFKSVFCATSAWIVYLIDLLRENTSENSEEVSPVGVDLEQIKSDIFLY